MKKPEERYVDYSFDMSVSSFCAGDRVGLRVVGVDGRGGLTTAKMVKYSLSDDGKNEQI